MLISNGLRLIFFCLLFLAQPISFHSARNTFAATVTLANRIPKEHVGEMLGYSSDYMLRHYMQALERNSQKA